MTSPGLTRTEFLFKLCTNRERCPANSNSEHTHTHTQTANASMLTKLLSDCVYRHTRFSFSSWISSPYEPISAPCSMRTAKFSSGYLRGRAVNMTIHLHLMLKLRMSGAVPTLRHMTSCPVQIQLYIYESYYSDWDTCWVTEDCWFDPRRRQEIFLFFTLPRMVLKHLQLL